jgi:hypothetical protein
MALGLLSVVAVLVVAQILTDPGHVQLVRSYELVDEQTIAIQTGTSSSEWRRDVEVVESSTEVRVTVRTFNWPFTAGTGVDLELLVDLDEPLGDRRVFGPFREVPRR